MTMPSFLRKLQRRLSRQLFVDGDDMFKVNVSHARIYAQFGFGKSALWVMQNTSAFVYMVDTSQHWISFMGKRIKDNGRFRPCWVDVGEIGYFGSPTNLDKRENFPIYTDWLWQQKLVPDVVLIDGRFRVCCFLTALKLAPVGTRLIFDDYFNREFYRVVEELLPPVDAQGRQALFVVPEKSELDMPRVDSMIKAYRLVTE